MTRLYPYQVEGGGWLSRQAHGYLADEMRLGKTPQAVEAVNISMLSRPVGLVVCVVSPAFLKVNWGREIDVWSWLPWPATLLSYEIASRDGLPEADVFIFDEAHYLANPTAKRTQNILGLDGNALVADHPLRRAKFVWALSGTPGDPSKVWSWLRVFGATQLDHETFTLRYCRTRRNEWGLQVMGVRKDTEAEFKALKAPWFLRRTAAELGWTAPVWGVVSLACGVDSDDEWSETVDPEDPEVDEHLATRVRELGEAKARPCADLIRYELKNGLDKIVVFAWHKAVLAILEEELAEFGVVRIDGDTPAEGRQALFDTFNTDPTKRVMAGQIRAAGVGGDAAQGACDVLFVELSWNPDDNAQAAKRVQGPKQTRPVNIRVAASEDPLDFALTRVNARKAQTVETTWS